MAYELGDIGDIKEEIRETLNDPMCLGASAPFCFSARIQRSINPGLRIHDHGIVGLPLSKHDAAAIRTKAKQSPFGKGEQTIVDLSVRKSWELSPSQFTLANPEWQPLLRKALSASHEGLHLNCGLDDVEAQLYKLLLYDEGAFFKPHQDSEKAKGMFGTMVICLPAKHEGGSLVFRHGKKTNSFESSTTSAFGFSVAAWYADVTHEVLPVTSGLRLVLTYNLVRKRGAPVLSRSLCTEMEEHPLKAVLSRYNTLLTTAKTSFPPFLVHGLAYKYSQSGLKASALKGDDVVQVDFLREICDELGFKLYLATCEREVTREDFEDREWSYDGVELEKEDSLQHVIDLNGKRVSTKLHFDEDTSLDQDFFDGLASDEVERTGYTGNAGATATYWYRKSVVIIVPKVASLRFLHECSDTAPPTADSFKKLRAELGSNPHEQAGLMLLCEAIIDPSIMNAYSHHPALYGHQKGTESDYLLNEAVLAVIDFDRLDLADRARIKKGNDVLLRQPGALGRALSRYGMDRMQKRLETVSKSAPSISDKMSFFQQIEKALKSSQPPPGTDLVSRYHKWYAGQLLSVDLRTANLEGKDGSALARLSSMIEESVFLNRFMPVMVVARLPARISFASYFTTARINALSANVRTPVENMITQLWDRLQFSGTNVHPPLPHPRPYNFREDTFWEDNLINGKAFYNFVNNTQEMLSHTPDSFWNKIYPATRAAEPRAIVQTVIPFVEALLQRDIPRFTKTGHGIDDPCWQRFVNLVVERLLTDYVGTKPQAPAHWTMNARVCYSRCRDCQQVNDFLAHPSQRVLDIKCDTNRRQHLHSNFTNVDNRTYTVDTLRSTNPNTWRITKLQGNYEKLQRAWNLRSDIAKPILDRLMRSEPFQDLVGDQIHLLIDLRCKVLGESRQALAGITGNTLKTKKRAADEVIEIDKGSGKRSRTNKRVQAKENSIEVIDLTEDD